MKILIISTFELKGGAAVACYRLFEAFKKLGHEAKLLVMEKTSNNEWVAEASPNRKKFDQLQTKFQYGLNARTLFKDGYVFSNSPWRGHDISTHPWVQEADVLNLHWINHGFLGLGDLDALFKLNKPIAWHMHDCWSFTGGCHYTGSCTNFERGCGNCPALRSASKGDISSRIYAEKQQIFEQNPPVFVGSSAWLTAEAAKSGLSEPGRTRHIRIPIDTDVFFPVPKAAAKERYKLNPSKTHVLFAAMNAADPRKGFAELIAALQLLGDSVSNVEIVVAGKADERLRDQIPFPTKLLGAVKGSEMVEVYRAADLFVIPSKEDNLPNTVLESLACGTPVVGFAAGGIPEMIDQNETGVLAELGDTTALADAIEAGIALSQEANIAERCVESMKRNYSQIEVVEDYIDLFREMLKQK